MVEKTHGLEIGQKHGHPHLLALFDQPQEIDPHYSDYVLKVLKFIGCNDKLFLFCVHLNLGRAVSTW